MNTNEYVVRIVKPANKPTLPPRDLLPDLDPPRNRTSLKRPMNILAGSAVGFAAGMAIYLMLRAAGVNFGGIESSVIIGLPSVLGVLASFAIH